MAVVPAVLFFENTLLASFAIWLLLGLFSAYSWERSPVSGARDGLLLAAVCGATTLISFAMDCAIGKLLHPERGWIDAGTRSLGFLFTLVAGGVSVCAFAGAVRDWVLGR